MNKFIPLSIPNFEGNEEKYVVDAIASTFVSTVGGYVSRMEKELASFLNVDNVAVCQSGTSALHLSMVDAGVKPGNVVLVPPLTFIAAVNPVKYQFATPVFIDCDDSFCLDPVKLRSFCEEECVWNDGVLKYNGADVKAIVVVHVFGNMADMESIMDTAEKYNLKVIEDATEALGTKYTDGRYAGKFAGTIGDYGCYSFNGNKIITTGGGGAVTSGNSATVDHIRFLSTQAKTDPHYYIHDEVGYNYRMTNLQAALGVAQLEELPEFIKRKQKNFDLYKSEFEGFKYGKLIDFRSGTESNKWFYSIEIDREHVKASMREIIISLEKDKIQTRAIWGLINEQKPYEGEVTYKLEKAPYYAERILNIPSSTQITEEEIKYVADKVKQLLEGLANG
ncbi:aminotransferase, LLPSF_NHT_00031 family [Eubacterium ruminantium]|uniref:Aminotransferase, LLPSF_NHT_00031 family n=1 Tax=Eubacterium ruminantium TaxID=42322 RepID=A0A1T4LT98_9FIRM|nr:LegC family aminotransferase [Eubacterium ruminantium]SCW39757.1 aminotransferase, LLPSF_NHT_00031 family [Eubacterium ruminantium]SDM41271.1 aminotransferase, LLPSF_NHT_00031 family [Eubacterium ruminantium]SJZ57932.1 aminotransferase, LLPSF_NHT_00031 family [Eubacterium ruminantium]